MWGDLTPAAKVNVYANETCDEVHTRPVQQSAVFPKKVLGTKAMLLYKGQPVTKKIKHYTSFAATATRHKNHIFECSRHHDPDIPKDWTPATFDDIDWRIHSQAFNALSPGHKIQISKYAHGWAPTKKHLNKMDNSVDSRCFACRRLHEDTHHVLRCISDDHQEARCKATSNFNAMLSKYHTPKLMAEVIINSIEQWSTKKQVTRPTFHPQDFDDELDQELNSHILTAFNKQTKIGWAHFAPLWTNLPSMETSDCILLPIPRTWRNILPQPMDAESNRTDVALLHHDLALPEWQTPWTQL